MLKEQLSIQLTDKRKELIKRISAIEADFHKGRSQDFAEQASETENDGVLDEIHHEAKAELRSVNEAIERIKNGLYGSCTVCNQEINPKRLSALPYITTCIDCAN